MGSIRRRLLTSSSRQATADHLPNSPYACDSISHWCFRTLLQMLPALHPDPNLRHESCHCARANTPSRPLHVRSSSRLISPRRIRSGAGLSAGQCDRKDRCPAPATNGRGHCAILLPHPSFEVLPAARASSKPVLPAAERSHVDSIQRGSYRRWYDMAHTAWHGEHRVCCGLESGSRECGRRCGLVWWCRRKWRRGD